MGCQADHVIEEQISQAGRTLQEFCGILRRGKTVLKLLARYFNCNSAFCLGFWAEILAKIQPCYINNFERLAGS